MKRIVIDSIGIEGFRSYVEPTIVSLTATAGIKFIGGDNRVEPELESNGAGKSTLFDAICWVLYGTSVKGLRASDLMARGARTMQGMLILQIDGETVAVTRTSPPNRLAIDGEPVEQDEVDRLVGLSRGRFLNSVIHGQAVPLFLDLAVPQRGDLLDEVLDLEIWMRAAAQATKRHNATEAELTQLRLARERLQGQLDGLPDIAELQQQEDAWQRERDDRLRDLIVHYEACEAELKQLRVPPPPLDEVTDASRRYREQRDAAAELHADITVMQSQHADLVKDIAWFSDNNTCPVCHQKIDRLFATSRQQYSRQRAGELDQRLGQIRQQHSALCDEADKLEDEWRQFVVASNKAEAARGMVTALIDAKRHESEQLQRQAVRVKNEKNPYTAQRQNAVAESFRLRGALNEQDDKITVVSATLNAFAFWRQGFRRVRLFCLDAVLRELTLETRNALAALGLPGWAIHYSTATETRSGTQRLGVQVRVAPPGGAKPGEFDVLSGGEGQRARLAASLGLASLIQRWAGVSWNTEVWDEPTAWLSTRGVENLLDALVLRAEAHDKSILLADHRSLAHSGFVESYLVTKDERGSRWEQV